MTKTRTNLRCWRSILPEVLGMGFTFIKSCKILIHNQLSDLMTSDDIQIKILNLNWYFNINHVHMSRKFRRSLGFIGEIEKDNFWSTWTFDWLPTYLTWTIVDIWLTTYLPHHVHVVCEQPSTKSIILRISFSKHCSVPG